MPSLLRRGPDKLLVGIVYKYQVSGVHLNKLVQFHSPLMNSRELDMNEKIGYGRVIRMWLEDTHITNYNKVHICIQNYNIEAPPQCDFKF